MKKLFLFFCFILLTSSAFAQIRFIEYFDYPAGDSLGAHGWTSHSGGSINRLLVTSPGLTYAGYPLSNIGNATTLTNTGQDAYHELTNHDSTGSVYATFMVRVDSAKAQGDYFLALLQTGSTTFYEGRVSARVRGGNLNFGITKGNSSTDTSVAGIWTTGTYSLGVTYLLVLKYTFNPGTGTDDQVSLFVFSSGLPATEPVTPTVGPITYSSSDASSIGRIALRQGTNTRAPSEVVDGILVTTSWSYPIVERVKIAVQGLYDISTSQLTRKDTVDIYLHHNTSPFAIVDSAIAVVDSVSLIGNYAFANAPTGTYYLEARYRNLPIYRNGINTWSKSGGEPFVSMTQGSYNFTSAASQAFGNNEIQLGTIFAMYNGDPTQDGTVDLSDLIAVYNDASNFITGYVNTDNNGDNFIDLSDLIISFNNSSNFVSEIRP